MKTQTNSEKIWNVVNKVCKWTATGIVIAVTTAPIVGIGYIIKDEYNCRQKMANYLSVGNGGALAKWGPHTRLLQEDRDLLLAFVKYEKAVKERGLPDKVRLCITRLQNEPKNSIEKMAQGAAMSLYEPVGNGGALAEKNKIRSSRRMEMFYSMNEAYERAM